MAQDSTNPFVLPGFGQQGESAGNPLLAGLDMMRQAWQNLAGAGRMDAPAMPTVSLEDLDRRIRELQTVQNWLQLNATMLSSTIQGLEIQRSTLKTFQSFTGSVFPDAAKSSASTRQAASADASADDAGQAYAQAAGDWWNMVQQQFEQLRDATTASLSGMAEAADTATGATKKKRAPTAKSAAPKTARKTASKASPARKTTASRAASTRKPRA
ncbi:PhaM family polyhydroxyalkanoate granule multifunctional regulatory protein [Castellaniella sp.]|uniref:PhaM family polyhydroxyalkanoate granule multifunctional regulatory protein n=1 Tax=Castellaniella sp. TaxID=1955812 RepID=UPI002AFE0355|nr:PhaM family polyhydroxyalkanoate granule multifunctional regulatory protein [Castellaniella sp.]